MKTIIDVYPEIKEEFSFICDYNPLIKSFEYDILLQIDEEDYQGDSFILLKNKDQIGYLCFGWGSCSGCDSLQACESIEDIKNLQEELHNDIKWFDTPTKALNWFTSHDWEGDHVFRSEYAKIFILKAKNILGDLIK